MTLQGTYPGVYIREIPSGVRTISGVPTAVGAFVDWFPRGPMNRAVRVSDFGDVERVFGGLHDRSEASYGLDQFFRQGGAKAWVVRVPGATAPVTASVGAKTSTAGGAGTALTIAAASPGEWGNNLRATIEPTDDDHFNLVVREVTINGDREVVVRQVSFANVTTDTADARRIDNVVNPPEGDTDALAEAVIVVALGTGDPMGSGTIGSVPAANTFTTAPMTTTAAKTMAVTLKSSTFADDARTADLGDDPIATIQEAAARLQGALRAALPAGGQDPARPEYAQARVRVATDASGSQYLQVIPGTGAAADVRFEFAATGVGDDLGLDGATKANVAAYNVGSTTGTRAQDGGAQGTDGSLPGATQLVGSQGVTPPTGIYALESADIFNLLCLPRVSKVSGSTSNADDYPTGQVAAAIGPAIQYCEEKRAMLLLDPPAGVTTVSGIQAWMTDQASLRHRNVALHFPRIIVADPANRLSQNEFRDRSISTSGAVAGLCARTDATRGVWKAPAGTEATIRGPRRLEVELSDDENGELNPLGINCLRRFDLYGNVNWGSRTLFGEDARGSEWRYLPVRRLALYLEETLFRSTKWVIHEPNDEPLWAQIRLSVGAFMNDLFRQGAFAGQTKQEAYFVRCDATTTTPLDQQRGYVNLVVGFAPLRPAEFLIISIQQIPDALEV